MPFVRALANELRASVTVLGVVPLNLSVMPARMDDDVAAWTRALQSRLDQALTTELDGDPGFRITEVAHNQGFDLIMMPTQGLQHARRGGAQGTARVIRPMTDWPPPEAGSAGHHLPIGASRLPGGGPHWGLEDGFALDAYTVRTRRRDRARDAALTEEIKVTE